MEMPQRLDRKKVQRKPDRPPPIGIAAEKARVRLAGLVVEPGRSAVEIQNQRVFEMITGERPQSIRRQEFALVEHAGEDALKARLLDERDETWPTSGRKIIEMISRP